MNCHHYFAVLVAGEFMINTLNFKLEKSSGFVTPTNSNMTGFVVSLPIKPVWVTRSQSLFTEHYVFVW